MEELAGRKLADEFGTGKIFRATATSELQRRQDALQDQLRGDDRLGITSVLRRRHCRWAVGSHGTRPKALARYREAVDNEKSGVEAGEDRGRPAQGGLRHDGPRGAQDRPKGCRKDHRVDPSCFGTRGIADD